MKLLISIGISILLMVACQTQTKHQEETNLPLWTSSMKELKRNLMILQPYIFNANLFEDSDNREFLSEKIHQLAMASQNVQHDPRLTQEDPTVQFVAVQFADELREADDTFKGGWKNYSRSQLAKVTSYCLECHTRLPQGPTFLSNLDEETFIKKLHIADRIELMIAFRQFDGAFNLAIESLNMPQNNEKKDYRSDRIARLGLNVAVQYLESFEKTKKIITAIDMNSTLPFFLKQDNLFWKASLKKWSSQKKLNSLPRLRTLINSNKSEIDDMRAISALLLLLNKPLDLNDLGEVLYLLGNSYERLNKVPIMSLHENYYEMCIRKAPQTKWARMCLARYEDSIINGFTGSAGTHVPVNIKTHIDELRRIIEYAQ